MDISPTALVNASTQMQQSQVAQAAQILVLKKAMDIQETGALALLQALPRATSGNFRNPDPVGIDVALFFADFLPFTNEGM